MSITGPDPLGREEDYDRWLQSEPDDTTGGPEDPEADAYDDPPTAGELHAKIDLLKQELQALRRDADATAEEIEEVAEEIRDIEAELQDIKDNE